MKLEQVLNKTYVENFSVKNSKINIIYKVVEKKMRNLATL